MNRKHTIKALFLTASLGAAFGAMAQTTAGSTVGRNVNQEQRIENGLQNGTITTREGAQLQKDEARVDHLQAKDMKNGTLSNSERAQLNAAQNKTSRDIHAASSNGVNGNPLSASSQRMQVDTQRNINQQSRIAQGVQNKTLTHHEVGSLERGQSHVAGKEYAAGRDGHVGAHEQASVQRSDAHQSHRIHRDKTNAANRG